MLVIVRHGCTTSWAGWTSTTTCEQADAAAQLRRLGLAPAIVFGTGTAAGILADLCLRHPHVLQARSSANRYSRPGVSDIGAINAARQARMDEGMAWAGPRAALELYLRGVAGDAVYESLDPQLRERLTGQRRGPVQYRDGSLPRLRPRTRPARSDTSAPLTPRSQPASATAKARRPGTGDTRQRNGSPPPCKPTSPDLLEAQMGYLGQPGHFAIALRPILGSHTRPEQAGLARTRRPSAGRGRELRG